MGRGTFEGHAERSCTGQGTLGGGPGWVGGPSERSETVWGTLKEVGDRLEDPREVRDGSADLWGPGRIGGHSGGSGQVAEPSKRYGVDRVILGEDRDGSGDHP